MGIKDIKFVWEVWRGEIVAILLGLIIGTGIFTLFIIALFQGID